MDLTLNTRIQLRNDTEANWLLVADTFVPLAGEVCITNDGDHKGQMKVGDGVTTWGALPYMGASASLEVSAEDVTFPENFTFTETFGKYEPGSSGSVEVPAAGKTLTELLTDAFSEDRNPTITQPSASVTSAQMTRAEVGTNITPTYSVSFNPGNYQYGPATGVTANAYSVTFNSQTLTEQSGTFNEYQIVDDTNLRIQAQVTHSAGAVPVTALGAKYADGQIKEGTKSAQTGAVTGYRKSFWGTYTAKDTEGTTSESIRTLQGSSNQALANGSNFTINIPVGALRVCFAYPAALRDVTSVKDVNGLNAEIASSFTLNTVQVAGANNYSPINYKVYTLDFANANDTVNTYTVQI